MIYDLDPLPSPFTPSQSGRGEEGRGGEARAGGSGLAGTAGEFVTWYSALMAARSTRLPKTAPCTPGTCWMLTADSHSLWDPEKQWRSLFVVPTMSPPPVAITRFASGTLKVDVWKRSCEDIRAVSPRWRQVRIA